MESKHALDTQESIASPMSQRGDELLSLSHDALSDSHDRDYRCLRIFFVNEFASADIRVRVADISAAHKSESRLRIDVFNLEVSPKEAGLRWVAFCQRTYATVTTSP